MPDGLCISCTLLDVLLIDCPPGPLPADNLRKYLERIKGRTYHEQKTHRGPLPLTRVIRVFDELF